MPIPKASAETDQHGPFCVSPPLGDAIRVRSESGDSHELSLNLARRRPEPEHEDLQHLGDAPSAQLRLLVETEPGTVTAWLLDARAVRQLIAASQLGIAALT